jgi:hypothetical protein
VKRNNNFIEKMRYTKQAVVFTSSSVAACFGYNYANGNEKLFGSILMPAVQKFVEPESAHRLAVLAAKYGIVPREHTYSDEHILVILFLPSF